MSSRVSFLVLFLICCCALTGAAAGDSATAGATPTATAAPATPAATAPARAPLPAWLKPSKPSASLSVAPSTGKAPGAPVFLSTCSNECNTTYHDCVNGCAGDHDCIVNCNNDWYCCLEACDGFFCD